METITAMITIPSKFSLGGRTWAVEFVDCIEDDPHTLGTTSIDDATIKLKRDISGELLQHTFYHELVHALCFTLGWDRLNKNEGKVDALGGLLYQYLRSKRGKL